MFMRYLGGGIGHKATEMFQQHTVEQAHEFGPDLEEDPVIADDILDEIRPNNDDIDDEEVVDEVDEEEEADYGYGDDVRCEDGESDQAEDDDDDDDNGDCDL
jgi:hypothetical protein